MGEVVDAGAWKESVHEQNRRPHTVFTQDQPPLGAPPPPPLCPDRAEHPEEGTRRSDCQRYAEEVRRGEAETTGDGEDDHQTRRAVQAPPCGSQLTDPQ